MFCPNCGRELKDGEVCSCTSNKENSNPAEFNSNEYQQTAQQTPQQFYQPPVQQVPQWAPAAPAIEVLKRHASSGMSLAYCVLLTIAFVGETILGIFSGAMISDTFTQLGMINFNATPDASAGTLVGTIIGTIIGAIPQILIVVGSWLFYKNCKNPAYTGGNASGLGLIKAAIIVNIVFCSLGLAGMLILTITGAALLQILADMLFQASGMMNGDASMAYGVMEAALIAVVVGVIIGIILALVFLIFQLKTVNSLKNSAITGAPATKISMFVIVMLYIGAVFSIIGSIGNYGLGLVAGAQFIIAAILLQRIRKEMLSIAMSDARAAYNAQAYSADMPQSAGQAQTVCPACGMNYDPASERCPRCGTPNQYR